MRAALLLALIPLPAAAAQCPGQSEIFSCQIGTKTLEICHENGALIYSYGPRSVPELTISDPVESVDYVPWSGWGRNRFYTVTFRNSGFSYEVWSDFDRLGDPRGINGGVTVRNGNAAVVELTCDLGSATRELEIIGDLKSDLGQCFDQERSSWRSGPCGRNPEFCSC